MSKNKPNNNWVDFKELKTRVSMEMVLDRFGILGHLKPSGASLVGCCPIHEGTNPRQFSVTLEKNAWKCFGNCQTGGNVLDFVAAIEKVDLKQAAKLLNEWFPAADGDQAKPDKQPTKQAKTEKRKASKLVREGVNEDPKPENKKDDGPINPPLKFELKSIIPDHVFFEERGIGPEAVAYFGLGFCNSQKGIMAGRIVIPIHNEKGELVAYAGRAITDKQMEEAKYKLPPNFHKSAVVYNLHRQKPGPGLIIVESYLSVYHLHQLGYPCTVALLGSAMSEEQAQLVYDFLGPRGRAIIMLDADEAGMVGADKCLQLLGHKLFVKAVDISPYGKKPHQLEVEVLKKII